jgi:hypothetical protein
VLSGLQATFLRRRMDSRWTAESSPSAPRSIISHKYPDDEQPIRPQLGRASEFARDDPPAAELENSRPLLARAAPPEQDVAFLADLVSLPASERHPLPDLSPQRKKERTLEALGNRQTRPEGSGANGGGRSTTLAC